MKASKIILGLLILFVLSVSEAFAQQQFTQTVTAQNKNCNATCSVIDLPELNNNPAAVVFITPIGGTSNPHPIGAYYMYLSRWSVFNLDAAALPAGAAFKVEYYASPDANHFVYSIQPRVNTSDPAYLDNAGLNNNPNAQIRVFPHCSPTIGNIWNKLDVKVEYDKPTSKWFIANLNAAPITPAVAYNVMFSNGYSVINENVNKTLNTLPKNSTSNLPVRNGSIKPVRILSNQPSQEPLSGPSEESITVADLVGDWRFGSSLMLTYLDHGTGDYSHSGTIYGLKYSIKPDGTFYYKFAGRIPDRTIREWGNGTVILINGFITFRFDQGSAEKYKLAGFRTKPNGEAALSLVQIDDTSRGRDTGGMLLKCGHSKGYFDCPGNQEWVRTAKPEK